MAIRISVPFLEEDGVWTKYEVHVTSRQQLPDSLWFKTSIQYRDLLSTRSDAAAVGLLIPAMLVGEDIHVEGALSARLHHSINGSLQHILKSVIPELSPVDVSAEELDFSKFRADGVATGFSAGVDSFCVLYDHYYLAKNSGVTITHLLYNNVGSNRGTSEKEFLERYQNMMCVSGRVGLPLVPIHSNLDDFYSWCSSIDFMRTHTVRNSAAALLLQRGIGRFVYAAAYHFEDVFIGCTKSMGYSDPILLPTLSTDGIDLMPSGNEYGRVEKTLRIAEIRETQRSLDVCVTRRHGGNCSGCGKCKRTLLTLELAGKLEQFSSVFDLRTYYRHRERYILKVLRGTGPYEKEIKSFMDKTEFSPPAGPRLLAALRVPEIKWKTRKVIEGCRRAMRWVGR